MTSSDQAKSNAARAREWRAKHMKSGCRSITIMLPADAAGALDAIKSNDPGLTNAEAIAVALLAYEEEQND